MPRPIKKKIQRPESKPEDDVKSLLGRLQGVADEYGRRLLIGIVSVLVALLVLGGGYMYHRINKGEALRHEYEGYKFLYGLYGKKDALKSERLGSAVTELRESLDIRGSASAMYHLGNAYFEMGKYEDAASMYRELLGTYPTDAMYMPLARHKLALALMELGQEEQALKELDALFVESSSFKDMALMQSAQILMGLGREDEALSKLEELGRNHPESLYSEQARQMVERERPGTFTNSPAASSGEPTAGEISPEDTLQVK